jgi:hypothetical protein
MTEEEPSHQAPISFRSAVAVAKRAADQATVVTGTLRQLIDAGLLGVCLAFFITFSGFTKVDSFIVFAEIAFAVAMPMLVAGLAGASYRPGSPAPSLQTVSVVLAIHSTKLPEAVGTVAVGAGVVAFICHVNLWSGLAILLSSVAVFIMIRIRARMLTAKFTKEDMAEIRDSTDWRAS